MRYLIIMIYLVLYTSSQARLVPSSAVTFMLNNGRLGDNLRNYWQAKYFAQNYNMPLLCPLFPHSNKLALGQIEKKYTPQSKTKFNNVIHLKNDFNKTIRNNTNTLYMIGYYFASKHGKGYNDPKMINIMKKMIRPTQPIESIKLKKNHINVALHVRLGSGPDSSFLKCQKIWPTKFPPFSYYLEALDKVYELYHHQDMHIHIFTDTSNAKRIAKKLKRKLSLSNVSFSCREDNKNAYAYTVPILEDFFSMAKCDCLIRGSSGLSHMAQLVGNHKVIITPHHPVWEHNKLYIKKLGIINLL